MPFILATTNETATPDSYDTHRLAPYWMPTDSVGVSLTEIPPNLAQWLETERTHRAIVLETPQHAYRPVLHRITLGTMRLGLRETTLSNVEAEYVVYMPLIDKVLFETRQRDGLIRSDIYGVRQVSITTGSPQYFWHREFSITWQYGDTSALDQLRLYTTGYVDDRVPQTSSAYHVFMFIHDPRNNSSPSSTNHNQPQEVIMQHETTPRAPRAPLSHEFNTRIEQGDRMLARLKHAVMVLAAQRVHHTVEPIPTGEYPESEINAARRTLDRFFNAIAACVGKLPFYLENSRDLDRAARIRKMLYEIQDDVRVRYENTDFDALDDKYYALRNIYPNVREAIRNIIHEFLAYVTEQSGHGLFSMAYAFDHGVLRSADNLRINILRQRIDAIYSEANNDDDEIRDFLLDRGIIQCGDCNEWETADRARTPYNQDDLVCRVCLDREYVYSNYYDDYVFRDYAASAFDDCGDRVTIHSDDEDFYYDDDNDCYYHHHYERRNHLIASYHSTKREGFKYIESDWVKRNDRYIGVELEVECRDSKYDAVERLNDALNGGRVGNKVWFENDGSLSSSGFEMITNPMGLDSHADFWEWLQDKSLTRTLRSHDTSTCGLHIHVSNKNLNDLQLNRMNVFINHPDNQMLIKAVARRYATNYARIREKQMGKAHYAVDRYDALNLENDETVEFRIFKGTLKHESLMAALEFANAVVNFTNPASPAGFNLSTDRFIRFIAHDSQRSETRYLRTYLKEAGFTV